jgi:hypothetical protein
MISSDTYDSDCSTKVQGKSILYFLFILFLPRPQLFVTLSLTFKLATRICFNSYKTTVAAAVAATTELVFIPSATHSTTATSNFN